MTKNRQFLLGTALALGMALGCAGASAQVTYDDTYVNDRGETVIVHPLYTPFDRIESRQLVGRVNGEVDPVELRLSRPVSYSDLDLSNDADFGVLRARIYSTARDICVTLARHDSGLMDSDPDATRECVQSAAADALSRVPVG